MQYDYFIRLTKESKPSNKLAGVHLAIWYALKDNWEMAHNVVQDINTEIASWVHAYLHRIEGDISNAHYWYNRAKKEPYPDSLEAELNDIVRTVFL